MTVARWVPAGICDLSLKTSQNSWQTNSKAISVTFLACVSSQWLDQVGGPGCAHVRCSLLPHITILGKQQKVPISLSCPQRRTLPCGVWKRSVYVEERGCQYINGSPIWRRRFQVWLLHLRQVEAISCQLTQDMGAHIHTKIIITFCMYCIYQYVLCIQVCNVYTGMYCVYQYVLYIPVCNVYTGMYCVYKYVMYIPVCTVYTNMYCIYQYVLCTVSLPIVNQDIYIR